MFQGSIPQDMRAIVSEIVRDWKTDDVYVGCSGNFTVERILHEHNRFNIHGCDVTIYSCALGSYFSRQPFRIQIRDAHKERFGWMEAYMKTPAEAVATLMLSTRMLDSFDAEGNAKHNTYYERIYAAYQRQFPAMHEQTVARVTNNPLVLKGFHVGDVVPFMDTLKPTDGFISYPPFFSNGYEIMFKKLDMLFDWDKPTYQDIADANAEAYLRAIMNRDHWIFGSMLKWDQFSEHLRGMAQTTAHGVTIYVYSSSEKRRVIVPRQKLEPVTIPRLTVGETIGAGMKLIPLSAGQFQSIRSQYMNAEIKPAAASAAYAVVVGDAMVGTFGFSVSPNTADFNIPSYIYMLSDFAVSPTDYPRLSKLVLYAALSKETKLLAERLKRSRVRYLVTTAFTDNPISMKYRGLFELHRRVEVKPEAGSPSPKKYKLNYKAPMGQWTLEEGLKLWLQKHGQINLNSPISQE